VETANPCPGVLEAIRSADGIIIGPSNPVSSILPIISIPAVRRAIKSRKNRVAVSPIIGEKPVSGPADKFMRALGTEPSSRGVARLYNGLIDFFVIDIRDKEFHEKGVEVLRTDTVMNSPEKKKSLGEFVLRILNIS
jgi:LPPG:FO 2-phospho-L-lactate transferase